LSEVEAVSFQNRAGLKLFGTLHRPARARAGMPAVLLLSPGVKMRVGPGRLYLPLTDMLTAEGFTVLRFDFYGLGDSEGELAEKLLPDVYNHIEVGRYVDDTLSAIDWLRDVHGFQRFVLGGLCGAAITAVLAAQRDPRVEGLLSLGMTVTLASNAATPAKYMSGAELDAMRVLYLRKLFNPRAWMRFLTFRSDYSVAWHAMLRLFRKPKPKAVAATPEAPVPAEQRGNANPLFPPAYFEFLRRGGHAMMLFSEKDRLYSDYEEKFVQPYADSLKPVAGQIDQHLVRSANHVLSLAEWRREMVDTSRAWLGRRYPKAAS
jgi:pimeloyl-ACP methyl ester carboxylesterase